MCTILTRFLQSSFLSLTLGRSWPKSSPHWSWTMFSHSWGMCQMHNTEQCSGCVLGEGDRTMGRTASWPSFHADHCRICKYLLTSCLLGGSPSSQFKCWFHSRINERQHPSCCPHSLCLLPQIKIFRNWVRVSPFLISPMRPFIHCSIEIAALWEGELQLPVMASGAYVYPVLLDVTRQVFLVGFWHLSLATCRALKLISLISACGALLTVVSFGLFRKGKK